MLYALLVVFLVYQDAPGVELSLRITGIVFHSLPVFRQRLGNLALCLQHVTQIYMRASIGGIDFKRPPECLLSLRKLLLAGEQ